MSRFQRHIEAFLENTMSFDEISSLCIRPANRNRSYFLRLAYLAASAMNVPIRFVNSSIFLLVCLTWTCTARTMIKMHIRMTNVMVFIPNLHLARQQLRPGILARQTATIALRCYLYSRIAHQFFTFPLTPFLRSWTFTYWVPSRSRTRMTNNTGQFSSLQGAPWTEHLRSSLSGHCSLIFRQSLSSIVPRSLLFIGGDPDCIVLAICKNHAKSIDFRRKNEKRQYGSRSKGITAKRV